MTIPTQLVLRALLADPTREMYGVEVGDAADLPSGTVHPILARLENAGWLESRGEEADAHRAGRPARRYYSLTSQGVTAARDALANAYQSRTRRGLGRPAPEGAP